MALPTPPDDRATQHARGRQLRAAVPRSEQAELTLAQDRDPMAILAAQNTDRLQPLIGLRRERMGESAFAFFRGAAAVMAHDLAQQSATGVRLVICGDAHLSNFGLFASRDRDLVFDVNDFDEAAVGPWEWDLKRLVTSVIILGQEHHLGHRELTRVAQQTSAAYRLALADLAERSALERYYTRLRVTDLLASLSTDGAEAAKVARKATRNTSERALGKLATRSEDGGWTIIDQPPLTDRLPEFDADQARAVATSYLTTVPPDVAELATQFSFQDAVLKVVGVGSVGTRCLLALFTDPDGGPLFLQLKQASASVIEQALGAEPVQPHGRRVTSGQRVLQASSDPFLGDFEGPEGRSYYVRQYRDMKGGVEPDQLSTADRLAEYSQICAHALARAHAQSGLAATLSGYLGGADRITVADRAFADFGHAYAEVTRADHQLLVQRGW